MVNIDVKVIARFTGVLADQTGVIRLVDGGLQRFALADVFAANVDVASVGVHSEAGNQATFDQRVRIVTHDFAVFTGTGFGFIRIDHQIAGATVAFLGHEGPLEARRKARTATTTQPRLFHLADDPVTPVFQNASCAIPMATRLRAFQRAVVHTVDIGKDAVLILKHEANLYVSRLAARARLI